ncbi:MAG TPA: NAD-binding protein [Acidobacteriota bacterium]|nr:NAD-binding protein [Acidobacteriota bacterium]HQM62751.1 NAD-binding protein [Acidobacteriota bacterium]
MKFNPAVVSYFFQRASTRRNLRQLLNFMLVLSGLVAVYSVIFHFIMAAEGKDYSWITGVYWTLTVMSTLGFGDITFATDLGKAFSIVVLLSGMIFLLTLLPFMFIKFFYGPWIEAEARNRAPRELPPGTRDHVIITSYDPVTAALIEKLQAHRCDYVLVVDDFKHALELYDLGIRVAVGAIDDPETYRRLRADRAALVVATSRDEINTNVAFTVRELSEEVPILTTADSPHSVDILQMAGSTKVIQIYDILGRSLAAWTVGGDCRANIISRFDELVIAEFAAMGTPLVGQTLAESRLRERFGLSIVGIWERGRFEIPRADRRIGRTSALVLAGAEAGLAAFDAEFSRYHLRELTQDPILIVGSGRVGDTIAARFKERGSPYRVVEKNPRQVEDQEHHVIGDAADIRTLQRAWIDKTPAALITTHDDAVNIYLTKYLRSLRPDMQILSRANLNRNVSTLHRAGADFVMSYAALGADAIFNFLRNEDTWMLAEGLNIFSLAVPASLVGRNLSQSGIRAATDCSVIAIRADGGLAINPDPATPLAAGAELILIGTDDGERKFLRFFGS